MPPTFTMSACVLMTRSAPSAPNGRSTGSPSTSTSSAGVVLKRMRGGSLFTPSPRCFFTACETARLASRRSSEISFAPVGRCLCRIARYEASISGAVGKVTLTIWKSWSVTMRAALSTSALAVVRTMP